MNDAIKRITLDVQQPHSPEIVYVKKRDTGRKIIISLVDGGMPYHITDDCSAIFTAQRVGESDKIVNNCTINGCMIIYEVKAQVTMNPCRMKCEIQLYGSDAKLLTSARFTIIVDDSIYQTGDDAEVPTEPISILLTPANSQKGDYFRVKEVGADGKSVILDPVSGIDQTLSEKVDGKGGVLGLRLDGGRYYVITAAGEIELAVKQDLPTKVSQLENDSDYIWGDGFIRGFLNDSGKYFMETTNDGDKEMIFREDVDDSFEKSGGIADAKAVGKMLSKLSDNIKNAVNGDYLVSQDQHIEAWTVGRIDSGSHSGNTVAAYTTDIIPRDETMAVRFDATKYKAVLSFWNEDGTMKSASSWRTESPIAPWKSTIAGSAPGFRIGFQTLDNKKIDTSDLVQNVFFATGYPNEIARRVEALETDSVTFYVDGKSGSDSNTGSSDSPLKTISKALTLISDTATAAIYVKAGDYAETVRIKDKKSVRIMLWEIEAFSIENNILGMPLIKLNCAGFNNGLVVTNCDNVELCDIWVANTLAGSAVCNKVKDLKLTHCVFSDSGADAIGLQINNSNAFVRNCTAYNIGLDGFNLHGNGNSTFIDCVAHDCGDDGISHHDGCTGAIIGGEFYNCVKGGVSSPTYGADINVQGVYSHDNTYGLYTTTTDGYARSKARISNCVFKNNTMDILIRGTDAIAWNNVYDTKRIDSGSLAEY